MVTMSDLQNISSATQKKQKSVEIIENFPVLPTFESSTLCLVTGSEFNKYEAVINDLSQSPVFLQCQATFCCATSLLPKSRNNSSSH